VTYQTTPMPLYSTKEVENAPKLHSYDSLDEAAIQCYNEFMLVARIYYAMKEAACSEQSARMTAMDGASKNAGMCTALTFLIQTLLYII